VKARLAITALSLVLAGCTAPAEVPVIPPATTPSSPAPTQTSASPSGTATSPTPGVTSSTPVAGRTDLVLSGTTIGDRLLGATPQSVLEADLVARLGKPKLGRTQLCQLAGEQSRFAVMDHSWGGLTVHYRRSGSDSIAISWEVTLDRVPDHLALADRLPWRPTFAELASGDGVEVTSSAGVRTARLTGRAISYAGEAGAARPDTVSGGPELACR
jgi:hypothetical protein